MITIGNLLPVESLVLTLIRKTPLIHSPQKLQIMKTKKTLLVITILFIWNVDYAQGLFTLKGYVKSANDGKALVSADVFVDELTTGTITNFDGYYLLTLPQGNYTLRYSYTDCDSKYVNINLNENKELNVKMLSSSEEMKRMARSADDTEKPGLEATIPVPLDTIPKTVIKEISGSQLISSFYNVQLHQKHPLFHP